MSIADMLEKLKTCKGCQERRELIRSLLQGGVGKKVDTGTDVDNGEVQGSQVKLQSDVALSRAKRGL